MIKKIKIKKIIPVFLMSLLTINSFFAYAGNNDGSSFITKAEFDSIKNEFQSQINSYNTSIDNKIDAAIAAYLSGVQIAKVVGQPANSYLSYPLTIRYRSDFYNSDSTYNDKTCNDVFPTLDMNFEFQFNGYQAYINRKVECTTSKDWFNVDSTNGILKAIYKDGKYTSYDQFIGFWGQGGTGYYTKSNNLAMVLFMNWKYGGNMPDKMGGRGSYNYGTAFPSAKVNGEIVWDTRDKPTFNIFGNQDSRTNTYTGWTSSTWDTIISDTGYTQSNPFNKNLSSDASNVQSSCPLTTGTMDTSLNIIYMNPTDYVYTCYDAEKYTYFNQYTERARKIINNTYNITYKDYSYGGFADEGPHVYFDTLFDPGYVSFTENALSGRGTYKYTGVKAQDIYLEAIDNVTKNKNKYSLSDAIYLFTAPDELNEIDISFTFGSGRTNPLTLMVGTNKGIDVSAYDTYKFNLESGGVKSKELTVDTTDTTKEVKIKTIVPKGAQIFFKLKSNENVTVDEIPTITIVKT